jgi:hypothetical protein
MVQPGLATMGIKGADFKFSNLRFQIGIADCLLFSRDRRLLVFKPNFIPLSFQAGAARPQGVQLSGGTPIIFLRHCRVREFSRDKLSYAGCVQYDTLMACHAADV